MTSISCIITSYNNSEYLSAAIDSVLNQSQPVNEIIISDDFSTDNSKEIINSYANQYSQIRPIYREKNLGVGMNRDLALKAASHKLVTWLDGDDWFYPDKIKNEFNALAGRNAIAFSDVALVDNNKKKLGYWDMKNFPLTDNIKRLLWISTRQSPIPTHMMLPKEIYEQVGGIDPNITLYEDWDFKIRLACHPIEWVKAPECGLAYRQTGSGLSSASSYRRLIGQIRIIRNNRYLFSDTLGYIGYIKILLNLARRAIFRRHQ